MKERVQLKVKQKKKVEFAYLCDHHDNKTVLYNLIVRDCLRLIVHHFAVGDELLSCSIVSMRCFNQGFQSSDLLKKKTSFKNSVIHELAATLSVP